MLPLGRGQMFVRSVAHNLKGLARFSGRDGRALFWPYAIAVAILFYATSLAAMVPVMQDAMATAIRDGRMVLPDMASITRWTLVFLSVAIVLLAASVVRRLRDRGKSAAWALIPLALTAPSFVVTPNPIAMLEWPQWLFFAMFVLTLAAQISLVYLIVLLAGRSREAADLLA